MPLTYLLYRCPRCGHDPLNGIKDEAECTSCGTRYSRGGEGGVILVREPSGGVWGVPGHRLTAAMIAWGDGGGTDESGSNSSDAPLLGAEVEVRRSGEEAPVRWGGELLGFAEALDRPLSGTVRLTRDALILCSDGCGEPGSALGESREIWPLLDIRAVQTSSSSLQFSPSGGGLVQLRFRNDSPFRWEAMLRTALRQAYRREGMGEIVEFQPRIVVE
jgi:hypothetical protein